jgi:transcription antitermination factor NusG
MRTESQSVSASKTDTQMTKMAPLIAYRTTPRKEMAAAADARAAGHKAHVPREPREQRRISHHSKTTTIRNVPVAAGYVFATGRPALRHGVRAIGRSDTPGGITFEAVTAEGSEYIKGEVGRVDITAFVRETQGHRRRGRTSRLQAKTPIHFAAGDPIRVVDGPFAGKAGIFLKQRSKKISMIEIDDRPFAISTYLLQKPG